MDSIWTNTAKHPEFQPLDGEHRTDVLIIGGGMAGLLCAYLLQQSGVDCTVVEAGRICGGITKDTTAKITLQHGLIYAKLMQALGKEGAARYLGAQQAALEQYRRLCTGIACDYEEKDAFVYSLTDRAAIENEVRAYTDLGVGATFETDPALPIATVGAVRVRGQAQFHPLKFAFSIAQGLKIYENTRVLELAPHLAVTERGRIHADAIIVATHFPMLNKHGSYFLKLYQHRSYVMALTGAKAVNGMFVDASAKGLSFRMYGEHLLLGGGGHRTGKKGGGWNELAAFARRYYPTARETGHFATQDCMSLDGIPYIGAYSARTEGLYVTSGFNKWGMSNSMVGAMLLRDRILGQDNAYAAVFSPSRPILHPQLAVNAFETTVSLLTPTVPRCPHLGCALKYNAQEHSWDCSCHGSRFEEDGTVHDGPANGNLKRRKSQ